MTSEETFIVDAPPDRVWEFLTDPYQVATCLPGAAITEQVDDHTFLGTIKVKVGPITAGYNGQVTFERLDRERWEADLVGKGRDAKGGAEMRMRSRLVPKNGGTEVHVTTEVKISGLLAQMGRGMIPTVASQMFKRFAAAVQEKLTTSAP